MTYTVVTTNKNNEDRLEIWERKVTLRRIFQRKKNCAFWERRTNEELQKLFRETHYD